MSKESTPFLKQHIISHGTECKEVAGSGNGLFATRDFASRSQILFVQRPLILALESAQLDSHCYACLRSEEAQVSTDSSGPQDIELKTCTGCRTVRFCNKSCQKNAWAAHHKHECKIFAKLHPRILPSTVRGVMRLLLQRKHKLLPPDEWNSLRAMKSHQEDLITSGGSRWEDICLMSKAIHAYSNTSESLENVIQICCIMMVNSFTLTSPTYDPIGIALHPFPALINHSCVPNAYIRFDMTSSPSPHPPPKVHHGSISVHALTPIPSGSEIRITYIDATISQPRRQADLLARYFFTCTCTLCTHPPPSPSTEDNNPALTTAISLLHPTNTTSSSSLTSATKTPHNPSPSSIPALQRALASLYSFSNRNNNSSDVLRAYPAPQLRHQLILALLAAARFREALSHNILLCFRVDGELYHERHHPMRTLSLWRAWRLVGWCLGEEGEEKGEGEQVQGGVKRDGDRQILPLMACWLMRELLVGVLPGVWREVDGGGGKVQELEEGVVGGQEEGQDREEERKVPVGQFEVMVYQAFGELVRGGGGLVWRDYIARREYWDGQVEAWVGRVVAEVLKEEGRGSEAEVGGIVVRR